MRWRANQAKDCVALLLGGGGARASYQVGVLKALAEIVPSGVANPFPIICGASAGSINATVLAAYARDFHEGVRRLVGVWEHFETNKVFRSGGEHDVGVGGGY